MMIPIAMWVLYPKDVVVYSIMFEIPTIFIIVLSRRFSEMKFDESVVKCYREIMLKQKESGKPLVDIANEILSKPDLNFLLVQRVSDMVLIQLKDEDELNFRRMMIPFFER